VIGPDVDLVSRIEAVVKSFNLLLVVSDDFVRACGGNRRARSASTSCVASKHRTSCLSCRIRRLLEPRLLWRAFPLLPGNSRSRRFKLHGDAVEDRLSDHGFDIAVIRPVVHGHAGTCRGDLLPAKNIPVTPTVRQAHDALHHFIGDVDGDRPAMHPALEHRRLAIPHAGAFGVAGMNEKHAALAAGGESLDVVHPAVTAAQISSADEQ